MPPTNSPVNPYDIFELEKVLQKMKGRNALNDAFAQCIKIEIDKVKRPGWWRPFRRMWHDHYSEWAVRFASVGIVYRTLDCTLKLGIPREEIIAIVALIYPDTKI